MHNRNRLFRSAIIILSITIFVTQLSACGKKVIVRPDGTTSDQGAIEDDPPMLQSEVFAVGVKEALLEAVEKSESIGSLQFSLLFDPGAQLDETQSNYTKSLVSLVNTADASNSMAISVESTLDASSGDSSMVTSIQAGSEVAQSGGVYFTGNSMLIKKADVEKPMIQHTLDPTVAESFKTLASAERFSRLLSDTTKIKMNDDEWGTTIDAFLRNVGASAQETNYASETQSVTMAGETEDCTATTLTLTGENAVAIMRGLASLISRDPSFKSFFVSQYLIDSETYGVTGLDGVLRDLDALTVEERNAMSLTFKNIQGERTSAVYLNAVTGQKTMTILFKFFKDGYVKENNISFSGFDGSGVEMTEKNSSSGGDNYTGQVIYNNKSPGGVLQEHTEITTQSTITKSSYTTNAQFLYNRAAAGDMSAMEFNGSFNYSQQENSKGTTGTSTGTFTTLSDGEYTTLNMSMSLEQVNSVLPINVPQFIPAAGISTNDQASLYAALGEDFTPEKFNRAPASTRSSVALMLLFF